MIRIFFLRFSENDWPGTLLDQSMRADNRKKYPVNFDSNWQNHYLYATLLKMKRTSHVCNCMTLETAKNKQFLSNIILHSIADILLKFKRTIRSTVWSIYFTCI